MSGSNEEKQKRFLREGTPYYDDFEMAVSMLLAKKEKENPFFNSTLEMMKSIHDHLGECLTILGKTETLVEEARERNAPKEEIDKLVSLCLDLQNLQTHLSENIVQSINKIVDTMFPR